MKVSMIDYIGAYSKENGPVGHSLKVIRDYQRQVGDMFQMEIYAPEAYYCVLENCLKKKLPFGRSIEGGKKGCLYNMMVMIMSFFNISYAFRHAKDETVWFYNVDQFLFVYLWLFGMHGKKVIVTLFAANYPKRYHNYCFQKMLPKLALVVSSNPQFEQKNCHSISVPDYLYEDGVYAQYQKQQRKNRIVCLGTMNASKKILELVKLADKLPMPLEVHGLFYDTEYYNKVKECAGENVRIENRYLNYQEYLTILGDSKYCILPYSMDAYKDFTSGVLLECLYMGTVPITDQRLLEKMEVSGIGYFDLTHLDGALICEDNYRQILEKNAILLQSRYHVEKLRQGLKECLCIDKGSL